MTGSKIDCEASLDLSRQNMIKTLELFFEHTKYSLTLMITALTAVVAIAAFVFERKPADDSALRFAVYAVSVVLGLLAFVAWVSYRLVHRYYKLYVACYVYTARLHKLHSAVLHPWFVELEQRVGDIDSEDAADRFINSGTFGDGHSWYFYSKVIVMLGAIGAVGSILLLVWLLSTVGALSPAK